MIQLELPLDHFHAIHHWAFFIAKSDLDFTNLCYDSTSLDFKNHKHKVAIEDAWADIESKVKYYSDVDADTKHYLMLDVTEKSFGLLECEFKTCTVETEGKLIK